MAKKHGRNSFVTDQVLLVIFGQSIGLIISLTFSFCIFSPGTWEFVNS